MTFKEAFAKLIDVKTIVTFVITAVLAVLALNGIIQKDDYMIIAVMVFTYFFSKPQAQTPPQG